MSYKSALNAYYRNDFKAFTEAFRLDIDLDPKSMDWITSAWKELNRNGKNIKRKEGKAIIDRHFSRAYGIPSIRKSTS